MDTENKQTNNVTETKAPETASISPEKKFNSAKPPFNKFRQGFSQRSSGPERSKNPRRNTGGKGERVKPEFDQKILDIRRVTRVTKGGKRMNFSVSMVVGDKKGSVGV